MKTYLKASLLALLIAVIGITYAGRDGSGTYSLPAGNPVSTGTTISSTWANNTLSDIGTAITNSIAKDGQTVPTANLPMGAFKHTNVADATARNHYAAAGQIQDAGLIKLGSVSGTNTITGALNPAITSYSAGMLIVFQPANNNTGATTLAVNGLTALDVQKADGDALISGDLVAGIPAVLALDTGGDDWILLNPQASLNGIATSDFARLSVSNTFAAQTSQTHSSDEVLRLYRTSPYLAFYDATNTTRRGYLQWSSAGATSLALSNDFSGGTINLTTVGGGAVQANGSTIWTAANDGSGSGLDADTIDGVAISGSSICQSSETGCAVKHAYGAYNGVSGCVAQTGTDSRNMSCVRNSTGSYTMTVSGFSVRPTCTTSNVSNNTMKMPSAFASSTTSITVITRNDSNTQTDDTFQIICIGT